MTLGRLLYLTWHRPIGLVRQSIREGGPVEQWLTARGRREMRRAAARLRAPATNGEPLTVQFLTGAGYWEQTAFCAWSLARASGRPVVAHVLDDGSLRPSHFEAIRSACAAASLESAAEIEARLDAALPATEFPSLRRRREELPLMRKILDPHVGRSGWKLLLDSDLLFFRLPKLILHWFAQPFPLCATDIQNAYGYSLQTLADLAGREVRERINTGILGLRSDDFDWEQMERWCHDLVRIGGPQYYQEQALVALFLAGREATQAAPIDDYVTWPRPPEALACRATMHHYVAESKCWYFRHNWKHVLAGSEPS